MVRSIAPALAAAAAWATVGAQSTEPRDYCLRYYGGLSAFVMILDYPYEQHKDRCASDWETLDFHDPNRIPGTILEICPPDTSVADYEGAMLTLSFSDGRNRDSETSARWFELGSMYIGNGSESSDDSALSKKGLEPAILSQNTPTGWRIKGTQASFADDRIGHIDFNCHGNPEANCERNPDAPVCWTGQTIQWNRDTPLNISLTFGSSGALLNINSVVEYNNTGYNTSIFVVFEGDLNLPGKGDTEFWGHDGHDYKAALAAHHPNMTWTSHEAKFPIFVNTTNGTWFNTANLSYGQSPELAAEDDGASRLGMLFWPVFVAMTFATLEVY